jgi:hypothetical protein
MPHFGAWPMTRLDVKLGSLLARDATWQPEERSIFVPCRLVTARWRGDERGRQSQAPEKGLRPLPH